MDRGKFWYHNVTNRFVIVSVLVLTTVWLLVANIVSADAASSSPTTASEDTATRQLLSLLEPMKTFSADFSQTVLGVASQVLQTSEGKMTIQRPAHFRWEVRQPYPQLIVSAGKLLYLYDPDLEQVQVESTAESLRGTPALLLSGTASEISASFTIEQSLREALSSTATTGTGNSESFIFHPRDKQSLYGSMVLTFENGAPVSFQIVDTLGQKTEVSFFNIAINAAIDPKRFQFVIPKGVDVTGNAADRVIPAS